MQFFPFFFFFFILHKINQKKRRKQSILLSIRPEIVPGFCYVNKVFLEASTVHISEEILGINFFIASGLSDQVKKVECLSHLKLSTYEKEKFSGFR